MNYWAGHRLQQRVLAAQSHVMSPQRTWEIMAFGNKIGNREDLAPISERLLQETWTPPDFESCHLPFQAAAREARSLNSSGIKHAWAEPASEREPTALPTVHLQPAASSSVYHLCGNREAPERFFFKSQGFKALSKALLSHIQKHPEGSGTSHDISATATQSSHRAQQTPSTKDWDIPSAIWKDVIAVQ